ncbi:hypothetical protein JYU34_021511 [Plutella xylostella]|uniref:Uncharacterized protein n=1 Tax=Plutella xylostella TaxID=51655 RepID=A0ABQ7PVB7_PLUXY|nr:hypothetical protein JYU34_021511 [Plutella xylostella]
MQLIGRGGGRGRGRWRRVLTVIPGGPVRPSAPTGPGGPRSSGAVCSSDRSVDELLNIVEEDGEMLLIDRNYWVLTVIPGGPVRPSAPTGPGGPRSSGAVCSSDSSVDVLQPQVPSDA